MRERNGYKKEEKRQDRAHSLKNYQSRHKRIRQKRIFRRHHKQYLQNRYQQGAALPQFQRERRALSYPPEPQLQKADTSYPGEERGKKSGYPAGYSRTGGCRFLFSHDADHAQRIFQQSGLLQHFSGGKNGFTRNHLLNTGPRPGACTDRVGHYCLCGNHQRIYRRDCRKKRI